MDDKSISYNEPYIRGAMDALEGVKVAIEAVIEHPTYSLILFTANDVNVILNLAKEQFLEQAKAKGLIDDV